MSTNRLRIRLAAFDASIAEHQIALETLQRGRATVAAELSSKATFSVVTLPVEITTAIFTLCLPTIEELHENNIRRRDGSAMPPTLTAPSILVECCHAWRDIAVATPSLWTTLPLCLKETEFGNTNTAFSISRRRADEYVDRWLGRAGLRPLTIVFCLVQENLDYDHDTDLPTAAHCMRSAMRRYADRLEELDFKTTASSLDIEFMDLDRIHFPLLQRAVVGITIPIEIPGWPARFSEMRLGCARSLTKYEGPINDFGLFSLAPNVVEMKCDAVGGIYDKTKTVVLVHLRSLTLSGGSVRITWVLLQLTLPALVSLRISGSCTPDGLEPCLERSAPPLQTLSLALSHAEGEDGWVPGNPVSHPWLPRSRTSSSTPPPINFSPTFCIFRRTRTLVYPA
ncbi:hypothetical protein B0H16DRAFT_1694427 [Mycena metata]|uniref:F-box domain-containing protein n=1 Tax=Mycena metata TaxID=1033252 RepID=A0AAD7ICB6_9AGAR|nr:hypothetical protein B0H16DRAFT_1694427 [Mycena metata]